VLPLPVVSGHRRSGSSTQGLTPEELEGGGGRCSQPYADLHGQASLSSTAQHIPSRLSPQSTREQPGSMNQGNLSIDTTQTLGYFGAFEHNTSPERLAEECKRFENRFDAFCLARLEFAVAEVGKGTKRAVKTISRRVGLCGLHATGSSTLLPSINFCTSGSTRCLASLCYR